jgi:hypothetical protein
MDTNEVLTRIADKLDSQGNRLTAIESDLKHHISRSDKLEVIVQRHEKYFWLSMGAISLAGPLFNLVIQHYFK